MMIKVSDLKNRGLDVADGDIKIGRHEFHTIKEESGSFWFEFDVVSIASGVAFGFDHSDSRGRPNWFRIDEYKTRPLPTKQEKEIDALASIMKGSPMDLGNAGLAKYLHKNGYRKEVK